jgi:hypothetical protein
VTYERRGDRNVLTLVQAVDTETPGARDTHGRPS